MQRIVIFGATSAIAMAAARIWAEENAELLLIARNQTHLEAVRKDLEARGAAKVSYLTADLADCANHQRIWSEVIRCLPEVDVVLIAYGTLSNQQDCARDFAKARAEIEINFISVVSVVALAAAHFEKRGSGRLAVISSVAGDRGRQSNYIYASAKAGLSVYLEGLRARLAPLGVRVTTIKPGLVDTPMTAGMKKGFLFAQPETIARGIVRAVNRGSDTVYLPWFWWFIMLVIKLLPEKVMKRLKF